jgi:hypothetical protein
MGVVHCVFNPSPEGRPLPRHWSAGLAAASVRRRGPGKTHRARQGTVVQAPNVSTQKGRPGNGHARRANPLPLDDGPSSPRFPECRTLGIGKRPGRPPLDTRHAPGGGGVRARGATRQGIRTREAGKRSSLEDGPGSTCRPAATGASWRGYRRLPTDSPSGPRSSDVRVE